MTTSTEMGSGPASAPSSASARRPASRSIHGDDADDQDPLIRTDEEDQDELDLILS